MNSFKDIAYQILKEAGKPLHSKEITKIALSRGWLKTAGKTPEATMNAQLKKAEKIYKISSDVSTKQKGDIAEARIAELITLYGDTTLSCYKPISDDEGIDLIVKEKGSLKTMYIQIKSRFGDNPDEIFTATTKLAGISENYSMAIVFCFFDTGEGDLWDYLWFVPAPDLIKLANKLDSGRLLGFVAGRKKKESNKWDEYLIDKRDLANQIIAQMKRI